MKQRFFLAVLTISLFSFSILSSCKHDPYFATNPNNGTPMGGLCDPDTVYFQNQVLPLLVSSCTQSGCHNQQDHREGIVTVSYASIMSTMERVTQTDWNKNSLIRSVENGSMPRGLPRFTTEQVDLLKKWVTQGAQNNVCNESYGGCDTVTVVSYAAFIQPLIQNKCLGCHNGSFPQGNVSLSNYANVKNYALNGKLYSSVTRTVSWMPSGGSKLDDCSLRKIQLWVDAGAPQN